MTAKGITTGNGPADQLLESLRGRPGDPWSREESKRLVEWKHAIRRALPQILAAERNRTIASVRGRLSSHAEQGCICTHVLDEMEVSA